MIADGEALGGFWFLLLMVLTVSLVLVRKRAGWRAPPGQGRRVMVARPVTIAALYAVLGPLLSHVLVGAASTLASGDWAALPTFLLFAPLAYVFGVLPSAAAGFAVGLVHPRLDRTRDLLAVSVMAGAAAGAGAGILMAGMMETTAAIVQMAGLVAVVGGVAAGVCGLLLSQLRYLELPPSGLA